MKATTKIIHLFLTTSMFLGCYPPDKYSVSSDRTTSGDAGSTGNTAFTPSAFNKNYVFLESDSKVKDRNFYWTTLVEKNATISAIIENDEVLSAYLQTAKLRLNTIANQSNVTAVEFATALKFSDNEKVALSTAVKNVVANNATAFIDFSNAQIAPSGAFNIFKEVTKVDRLNQLIVDEMLMGINQIIDTYAGGIKPPSTTPYDPLIDKPDYDVNSVELKLLLQTLVTDLNSKKDQYKLFYQPFLNFALGVLDINKRDEAGKYFPMENGVNKAVYENIPTIKWSDFDYSVIVVLGDSPNSPSDLPNISLGGMARADYGVALYKQGKAPIIAFTGGHLFPIHTIYSEAIEMKKYVMDKYGIPENRILVDPHARHTTSNMRNIGRLFFRYGIPTDKKAIVSTTLSQSKYVASTTFMTRSQREMGHIPIQLYNRLSDFDLEFTPKIEVLHLDSSDPLDP